MNVKALALVGALLALVYYQYTRYKGDVSFGVLTPLPTPDALPKPGDPGYNNPSGLTNEQELAAICRAQPCGSALCPCVETYRKPVGTTPIGGVTEILF